MDSELRFASISNPLERLREEETDPCWYVSTMFLFCGQSNFTQQHWFWTGKANTESTRPFKLSTHFLCSPISRYVPIPSPPLSGQRLLYQAWVNSLCKCVIAAVTWPRSGHGQSGEDFSAKDSRRAVTGSCFSSWFKPPASTKSETKSNLHVTQRFFYQMGKFSTGWLLLRFPSEPV